jgi:KipI family sensor histidine kinase inhibitor
MTGHAFERPRFRPAGDDAVLVELGDVISPEVNSKVRELFLAIDGRRLPGIVDVVPAYRSLLISYEPRRLTLQALQDAITTMAQSPGARPVRAPQVLRIPTRYGGDLGPDLEFVARHNGLTPEEVVGVHADTDYLVYMMGFTPGFPYLGGMSERIAAPRLETPRTATPAGSVGIAQRQTGIYPVESPGGWRIIGRTPIRLFDPTREPPVAIEAGDYVRFAAIDADAYAEIARQVEAGAYALDVSEKRQAD